MLVELTCRRCGRPFSLEVRTEKAASWARAGAVCGPCGRAMRAAWDAQDAATAAEKAQEAHLRRVRASKVPKALLGRPRPGDAAERAARAWSEHGGLLVLWGKPGRGKSVTAACALSEVAKRRSIFWRPAVRLALDLRGEYGTREREEADWLARAHAPMVLDDLDKIRSNQRDAQSLMFDVVDAYIGRGTPLLVTMNASPDTLEDLWPETGEAVASRLAGGTVVHVGGRDWRRAGRTFDGAPAGQPAAWAS